MKLVAGVPRRGSFDARRWLGHQKIDMWDLTLTTRAQPVKASQDQDQVSSEKEAALPRRDSEPRTCREYPNLRKFVLRFCFVIGSFLRHFHELLRCAVEKCVELLVVGFGFGAEGVLERGKEGGNVGGGRRGDGVGRGRGQERGSEVEDRCGGRAFGGGAGDADKGLLGHGGVAGAGQGVGGG